ncbi:Major facilitator superfamily MFS_1 [Streptomyces microflavus DSM 40593]|uniref:Major facilitator superfamily MFS_1 n=2 Tax=Streptomyces microflavus TaxID=1919 RepID=N0CSD3_STRMI|nr:Major facilitator superfamily MFS_1 [Streptomyces microflavus DSM 40593]
MGHYDGVTAARSHDGPGPLRRAGRATGRALRSPFTGTARGIRKATHAHGAGESGLGKLIELHAVNGAGDVMITVALASTVFFSVPTDEARGRVALYLAITMAPFTLLAPVIGPLLDRLPHGRRAAMAGAMLARALLAITMSGAVATGGLELYPAALGVLVSSKAYGVVRSAVVPRLLPPKFSLVKANSRVTLAGLLATGVAAPIGAGLQTIGSAWPLYGACAIFIAGTFLAFTLPHKVDSAKGERRARLIDPHGEEPVPPPAPKPRGLRKDGIRKDGLRRNGEKPAKERPPGLRSVGGSVFHGLQANAAHRALSGFLIFFLAFLLREHPMAGQSAAVSLAIVGVSAGVGNACGTAVGAWLRARGPEVIIATVLGLALGTAVLAAVFFSTAAVAALGAVAGFTQALSKLSLDAMIQRDVPEEVRTSAFARSETLLQMAWVVGGGIGIALPLNAVLGMSVAAGILALGAATSVRGLLGAARRGTPHPRVA